MRINSTEEEDFPGQFDLWQANCKRSIKGRRGQASLRDLEAALLAMPDKRIIKDLLVDDDDICAIGVYAKHKGLDLSKFDPEYETDEVGIEAGMPPLVAWKIVDLNDSQLDTVWEVGYGPLRFREVPYKGGLLMIRGMTPEERYEKVLEWVRRQLV